MREEEEHRVIKQSQLGVPLRQKACLFAAAVPLWHSSVIIPPRLDNIMKWRALCCRRPAFKFHVRCKQARGQKPCAAGAVKLLCFFFTFFTFFFFQQCNQSTMSATTGLFFNKGDTHTQLPAPPSRIFFPAKYKNRTGGIFSPRRIYSEGMNLFSIMWNHSSILYQPFFMRLWEKQPICIQRPPFILCMH